MTFNLLFGDPFHMAEHTAGVHRLLAAPRGVPSGWFSSLCDTFNPGHTSAEEILVTARLPFLAATTVAADAGQMVASCARSTAGFIADRYQLFDDVPSYPLDFKPSFSVGRLLDEEEYHQPFCTTCSAPLIRSMGDRSLSDNSGVHTCTVWVPNRCPRCDPEFYPRGHRRQDFELHTLFLPTVLVRTYLGMAHMKRSHPKKNMHLGWTATCETSEGEVLHEAAMHFMSRIAQLQNVPARCFPRWASLPVLRWFDFTYPMRTDASHFASPWLPVGRTVTSVVTASHPLVLQDADVEERDGVVPARVSLVTNEQARAAGVKGTLPAAPGPYSEPLPRTRDGLHTVSEDVVAFKTGQLLGVNCVYAPNDPRNALDVMVNRIGGPNAEVRKFEWRPTDKMKAQAGACLGVLEAECFTRENIKKTCVKLGIMSELFQPKMSADKVREIADTLLAGYDFKQYTSVMVKKEVTAKPKKPARGVMDRGPEAFVASAYVHKIIEHMLSEFDEPLNIKHREKAKIMTGITRECSKSHVYGRSGLSPEAYPSTSARFIESDYGKFEYSQSLRYLYDKDDPWGDKTGKGWDVCVDDSATGMLAWERRLIRHVSAHLPDVLNELAEMSRELNLSEDLQVNFKPKVKIIQEMFAKVNFRLVLLMLCRKSGDAQTSYGNRLHNLIAMAVSTLEQPSRLFMLLADFYHGRKPKEQISWPIHWVFRSPSGRNIRFRPWAEGDDFIAHIVGDDQCAASPEECDLEKLPHRKQVLTQLNRFGLESSYFLRRQGRAEFVGVHFLIQDGFAVDGAWCPDVCRGLVKGTVATSPELRGTTQAERLNIALSFHARYAMFAGRVEPMATYWYSLAEDVLTAGEGLLQYAGAHNVTLDWGTASQLGAEFGEVVNARELFERLSRASMATAELPPALQKRLVEASVGGAITPAEWGNWVAAVPEVHQTSVDALAAFPSCIRNALSG